MGACFRFFCQQKDLGKHNFKFPDTEKTVSYCTICTVQKKSVSPLNGTRGHLWVHVSNSFSYRRHREKASLSSGFQLSVQRPDNTQDKKRVLSISGKSVVNFVTVMGPFSYQKKPGRKLENITSARQSQKCVSRKEGKEEQIEGANFSIKSRRCNTYVNSSLFLGSKKWSFHKLGECTSNNYYCVSVRCGN